MAKMYKFKTIVITFYLSWATTLMASAQSSLGHTDVPYDEYKIQLEQYIDQVEQTRAKDRLQRSAIEARVVKLEQQQPKSAKERAKVQLELVPLKNWLAADSKVSTEIQRNIALRKQWLRHFKDHANVDSYNLSEEKEAIVEQEKKLQQARNIQAAERRKAEDRAYWEAKNAVPSTAGGYRASRRHGSHRSSRSRSHPRGQLH
ncbi:MAG: hypothetical protein C0507_14955 [Cyanobacteria bacterium PR.3.49]|nr:hypothetical protein [Cyanobacteria bacterium PR.3.49]